MPITKARKDELVTEYKELLESSDGFTIVATRGMSVKRTESLRRKVMEAGGRYVVAKNTLITKALEMSGWSVPDELLAGPTAIVFGKDNFPAVAKAVLSFIDTEKIDENILKVTGGVMGGSSILDAAGMKAVSELPTLPELQSQILGLIVMPATNIVSVLDAADAGVVNVLQAWLDEKGA